MRAQPPKHPSIEPLESRIAPATFIVTTLADSGAGSLRAALASADTAHMAHGGVNTIIFKLHPAAPRTENTITLMTGGLTSMGDVNIVGPGLNKLIINGGEDYTVFTVTDGVATKDSPVSISGLTIIGGYAVNGAGINSTESLTLKNSAVSGNQGTSKTGGIYVVGNATAGTKVSILNSIVSGNNGSLTGGVGLYQIKSFLVSGSIISGNSNANGSAGGLYASIGTGGTGGMVINSRITGNTATQAAGLQFKDPNSAKTSVITVKNTIVTGNDTANTSSSSGLAGGILFQNGNDVITGCTIQANIAQYDGGGVFAATPYSLTISGTTITGNKTITSTSVGQGGAGLFVEGANSATLTPVKITGSSISNNTSGLDGGGILAGDGVAVSITASTFSGNQAPAGGGGGIDAQGASVRKADVIITASKFINNQAMEGGGITLEGDGSGTGDGTFSMLSSMVTGNHSTTSGGGLYLDTNGAITLKANSITDNVAGAYGGGVVLAFSKNVTVTGGRVSANSSEFGGGGLRLNQSAGTINNLIVTGNVTDSRGGGIYVNGSTFTLHSTTISANSALVDPDIHGTGLTFM